MPRCSIIIPVHNWASVTRQCLETVFAVSSPTHEIEVVVVDDASTDTTPEMLASFGDRITVVRHTTNTGFGVACNDGVAAARASEYVILLNNDTVPQPGWLQALIEDSEAHPGTAVVGSQLLFPNATIQHAGVVICQDRCPRHIYSGFPAHHPAVNKSRRFQIVTAACALIRRAVFEQIGGFDPAFRNGYEDVDLCLRIGEIGHEVRYCHRSVVYHLESLSRVMRTSQDRKNQELLRKRWLDRVRVDDLDYYLEDGLLQFSYGDYFPVEMRIDPLLGVARESDADAAHRLIASRARQVFDLLRENIRLANRLREAEAALVSKREVNRGARGQGTRKVADGDNQTGIHDAPDNPTCDVNRTPLLDPYASADNVRRAEEIVAEPKFCPRRPAPDEAGVSVLILNLDRPEYIIPLLDHLQAQQCQAKVDGVRLEVIVGDTGSTDPTVLRYYDDHARYITVVRDLEYNFSRCNNQLAFDHATCRALLFLNNDIIFPAGSSPVLEMYRQLESDLSLGVVGVWLFFPDGSVQHGGVDFSRTPDIRGFCYHPHARAKIDPNAIHPSRLSPAVTGACLMTRSKLFWQVGGMDDGYRVECQDIAYCLTLDRLGFRTRLLDGGNIVHLENGTRPRGHEEWSDRQRFLRKWGSYIEARFL